MGAEVMGGRWLGRVEAWAVASLTLVLRGAAPHVSCLGWGSEWVGVSPGLLIGAEHSCRSQQARNTLSKPVAEKQDWFLK